MVPASGGKHIFTPSASAAQEFFAGYFLFLGNPQKAASFPQIVIVIHGLFTAYPQTSVYNLRNIPIAFAGNRPVFNLIVILASRRTQSRPRLQCGLRLSRNARIPSRASGS